MVRSNRVKPGLPMHVALATLMLACAVESESIDEEKPSSEEDDLDALEQQEELAALAAGMTTAVNRDPSFVVVWSQNLAKEQLAPDGLVRCARDRACAGNYLPDVFLLNEANSDVAASFARRLKEQLGITYRVFADPSRAGTSVLWRRARFGSEPRNARRLAPRYKAADGSCTQIEPSVQGATVAGASGRINTGRNVGVVLDDRRSGRTVSLVSIHFPHPYEGGIPNCDYSARDYDGVCARRNIVDAAGLVRGDLAVLGGDFNYRSRCAGQVAGGFKVATDSVSPGYPAPLGFASAFAAGDGIDYLFARTRAGAAQFEEVARVPKTFYCGPDEDVATCAWSDHDLRRAIVHY